MYLIGKRTSFHSHQLSANWQFSAEIIGITSRINLLYLGFFFFFWNVWMFSDLRVAFSSGKFVLLQVKFLHKATE